MGIVGDCYLNSIYMSGVKPIGWKRLPTGNDLLIVVQVVGFLKQCVSKKVLPSKANYTTDSDVSCHCIHCNDLWVIFFIIKKIGNFRHLLCRSVGEVPVPVRQRQLVWLRNRYHLRGAGLIMYACIKWILEY